MDHEQANGGAHKHSPQRNAAKIVVATVERILRAVRTSTTLMWRLTLWTLQRENSDMMFDRHRLGRGAACLVPCVF